LEQLRVLRVELQKIQRQLGEIGEGTRAFAEVSPAMLKNVSDAKLILKSLSGNDEWERKLLNAWEDFSVAQLLKEPHKVPAERWPREMARLDGLLTEMVETIGEQTIPDRMDEWLDRLPRGFYFNFHTAFEDELPGKEARESLLRDLATTNRAAPSKRSTSHKEPKSYEKGLVDAPAGLVYRRWERWYSNVGIIALIVGGFLLTGVAMFLWGARAAKAVGIDVSGGTLAMLYGGILLGSLLHMVVAASKKARRDGAPPNTSPSYIVVWFACRFGLWAWTWVLSLFVLAGSLKFLGAAGLTFWTAILAGYSLDSVAETFGDALEKKALDHTDKVKEQLRPAT
jgi:hypothetical protein